MALLGLPNSGALAPCVGSYPPQLAAALKLSIRTAATGDEWEEVELPPKLSAIVFVNIPSHAAGRKLWQPCRPPWAPQDAADALLEVGGFATPCHFGCYLGFGFGHLRPCSGMKLAQAKAVRIETRQPLHMQADGEPWLQPAGVITICHAGASAMLRVPTRQEQKAKLAVA